MIKKTWPFALLLLVLFSSGCSLTNRPTTEGKFDNSTIYTSLPDDSYYYGNGEKIFLEKGSSLLETSYYFVQGTDPKQTKLIITEELIVKFTDDLNVTELEQILSDLKLVKIAEIFNNDPKTLLVGTTSQSPSTNPIVIANLFMEDTRLKQKVIYAEPNFKILTLNSGLAF